MKASARGVALAVAVTLVSVLAGCGGTGRADPRIDLLLPGGGTSRFGQFDGPLIEKRLKELCPRCVVKVRYAGEFDVATQQAQVRTALVEGTDALILDAVYPNAMRASIESARRAGVPVVSYDRLNAGPISGYVTFDGAQVGRIQGEALLTAMGAKAHGGQIVMMNGSTNDPNSAWFEGGALSALKGKVRIAASYDTFDWRSSNAYTNMFNAITRLGPHSIDGVVAANDVLAGGVIAALGAAKISPLPPVTGQDADITAVRRIVAGEQYMTVYKPFKAQADAAATMALALARGEKLSGIANAKVNNDTTRNIPSILLRPIAVTVGNIKDTLVKDGMYTISQICTPQYRSACDRAGLTG